MKHKNAILIAAIYIINMIAYTFIYKIFLPVEAVATTELIHAAKNIAFASTTVIATILICIINRKILIDQFKCIKDHPRVVAKYVFIGVLILIALECINIAMHGEFHMMDESSLRLSGYVWGTPLALLFIVCLPILEETVYKVSIFYTLNQHHIPFTRTLAALIFGAFHGIVIFTNSSMFAPALIFYTLLGIKFGYLYSKTHTIWTSIFVGIISYSFWFVIMNYFHVAIH